MNLLACFRGAAVALATLLASSQVAAAPARSTPEPILLVVMDPLAKELACACVKGFGQRDYRKLAARLEATTKQRVSIDFSDDLAVSLSGLTPGREVIVVGDESLVTHSAARSGWKSRPVCALTDLEGRTTLTAAFITRAEDPVKDLRDIRDRKLLFGIAADDAKYAASLAALRDAGVEPPSTPERRGSYTDAALDMLDSPLSPPPVAVVPAYALPLLEGCGSVKPGNVKVIARSKPVPFITVFLGETIPAERKEKILQALLGIKTDAKLLKAMESRDGFVTRTPPA